MRRNLLKWGTAVLLFSTAAGLRAADQPKGDKVDRQVERLTNQLGLSADQKTQVQGILQDEQSKMQAASSKDDRKAVHEAAEQKIEGVLTADQKTKYEQMKQKRAHGKGGHHGGSRGDAPPSSGQ